MQRSFGEILALAINQAVDATNLANDLPGREAGTQLQRFPLPFEVRLHKVLREYLMIG
jgi:hypothetical protein